MREIHEIPPEEGEGMSTLEFLAVLEEKFTRPVDRGWCGTCGLFVRLTPAGYLASHSYFMEKGKATVLFSWRELHKGSNDRAILHCSGGGNKPRKTPPK